jgi:hypothetical protein
MCDFGLQNVPKSEITYLGVLRKIFVADFGGFWRIEADFFNPPKSAPIRNKNPNHISEIG